MDDPISMEKSQRARLREFRDVSQACLGASVETQRQDFAQSVDCHHLI